MKKSGGSGMRRAYFSAPYNLNEAGDPSIETPYALFADDLTPRRPGFFSDGLKQGLTKWVFSRVPATRWVPTYSFQQNFFTDFLGGFTIGMVCLAQTLAHAAIATTNSIQGPYTAFVPMLSYAVLGTSPHASVSSGAIAAMIIAEQLEPWPDIQDRTELASLLALVTGITLMLMGVCNVAFAVRFLSNSTLSGFISGGAILIALQQMKNLLGYKWFPHTTGVFQLVEALVKNLHEADKASVVLGISLIVFLDICNRLKRRATAEIKKGKRKWKCVKTFTEAKEVFVVVFGVAFAYATAGADGEPIMTTVGDVPSGLPPFNAPWNIRAFPDLAGSSHHLGNFVMGGVAVALTSFVSTYATAKKMAVRHGYQIDAVQEMIALGVAGTAGSFYGAFPPSGSLSRTGLASEIGIKTQLGGAVGALTVGMGLTFLAPVIRYLPKAALAAIIIKSSMSLIDVEEVSKLKKYWRPKRDGGLKRDLIIWVIAFTFTVVMGVLEGIMSAVLLSVIMIVKDAAMPSTVVLGKVESLGNKFRDVACWPQAETTPGLLVVEFRGPLTFVSAEHFHEQVEKFRFKWQEKWGCPFKIYVISFSSCHNIDETALKMLEDLLTEWRRNEISCIVTGAKHQVRQLLQTRLRDDQIASGLPPLLDQVNFIISIADAVLLAKRRMQFHEESGETGRVVRLPSVVEENSLVLHKAAKMIQRTFRTRTNSKEYPNMDTDAQEAAQRESLRRPRVFRDQAKSTMF